MNNNSLTASTTNLADGKSPLAVPMVDTDSNSQNTDL
jgi:hypothetical protein